MAPSLEALKNHAQKYGREGVMESAAHLDEAEQEELRRFIRRELPKRARQPKRKGGRR